MLNKLKNLKKINNKIYCLKKIKNYDTAILFTYKYKIKN